MKTIKLQKIGSYTILARVNDNDEVFEFVAAYGYDEKDKTWAQGHYFTNLRNAVDFASNRRISYERMSEIATQALSYIDYEVGLDPFEEEFDINLSPYELEYFEM